MTGDDIFSTTGRPFRPVDLKFEQLQAGEERLSFGRDLCETSTMPAAIYPPGSTGANSATTRCEQPAPAERLPLLSPRLAELLAWLNREWDDRPASTETPIVVGSLG